MFSKLMMILSATVFLASCGTMTGTAGTECLVWKAVTWSKSDTDKTIADVKRNNARHDAWCGK